MSQDLWLLAGIVAFYVYDATVLLYADELVAWPKRRGWAADVGGDTQWRGGFLFLPSLWWPVQPLLKLHWLAAPATTAQADFRPLLRALRPLQFAVQAMAVVLFVALPLVLLVWRRADALLVLLAVIYLLSTCMVLYTVRARHALGLHRRALIALAIDTLACPPFALNLVRKIGLRQTGAVDGLAFVSTRLSEEAFRRLRPRLIARIDALLQAEPEQSAHAGQLGQARARLLEAHDGQG